MLNRGNFYLLFKLEFPNFVANWRYESYGKMQNFSSVSRKICLLGQKNRDMGMMWFEYHYSIAVFKLLQMKLMIFFLVNN